MRNQPYPEPPWWDRPGNPWTPKPLRALLLIVIVLFYGPGIASAQSLDPEELTNIRVYQEAHESVVNITTVVIDYKHFSNPYASETSGSGIVLDKEGNLLTNHHVITNASHLIEVTLSDHTKWRAKLVGSDPTTDLAVIRIKAPADRLHPIKFGKSEDIKVGQKVLAIGNPFGLEQTLTTGIVSSIRRYLKINNIEMDHVIQTDAAINPGNSGGPLLDSKAQMIGINTAIFTPSGGTRGNIGIGFSVPVKTVRSVVKELLDKGYVSSAWIGIERQTLIPEYAKALNLPVERGVLVGRLAKQSPAVEAGLRGGSLQVIIGNTRLFIGGDIITAADEVAIQSRADLVRFLRAKKPGQKVSLSLYRDGKQMTLPVTLGERPRRTKR